MNVANPARTNPTKKMNEMKNQATVKTVRGSFVSEVFGCGGRTKLKGAIPRDCSKRTGQEGCCFLRALWG